MTDSEIMELATWTTIVFIIIMTVTKIWLIWQGY